VHFIKRTQYFWIRPILNKDGLEAKLLVITNQIEMATNIYLTKADAEKCIAPYLLGKLIDCQPIVGGNANSSFLLTIEANRFILTICEQPLETIKTLVRLLQYLAEGAFLTNTVVSTTENSILTHHDKPYYLKTYLSGEAPQQLTESMLFQVGRAMGELHKIRCPTWLPNTFEYGEHLFDNFIEDNNGDFSEWLASTGTKFLPTIRQENLPTGLIHGDIFCDNTIFENEKLVAIIDFETACNHPFVFDIGMALTGTCMHGREIHKQKAQALLAGYLEERLLLDQELSAIRHYAAYAAAATAFWRYKEFNIVRKNSEKKNTHLKMVEICEHFLGLPEDYFSSLF